MRVAICTESYPPSISGVAIFASKVAVALKERGHEVIVLAPSLRGKPTREIIDGILVYRIRSIPSPFRRKLRFVTGQGRAVGAILKRFKPDIIHLQDLGGSSTTGQRWGKKHKVKVVGTRHFAANFAVSHVPLHKLFPEEAVLGWIDWYVHDFYEDCTVITTPTETVKRDILATGYKGPVEVVSNGVEIPPPPDLSLRDKNDPPIVLYVGRIDGDKNVTLLLKAAPLVHAKRPVQIVIVGDGECLREYRRYVHKHTMESYVRFTGALKPESAMLKKWYERANVMAMPSLIETQSITTMEAMAVALPVVAPRSGALPELITSGETGYLVPVPTPAHFAATICEALDNPTEAHKRGKAARAFVERHHKRSECIDHLISLYERTLAGEFDPKRS
jgi:1,2-diacylglycerol 3-alpha-glucosyltransferase